MVSHNMVRGVWLRDKHTSSLCVAGAGGGWLPCEVCDLFIVNVPHDGDRVQLLGVVD